MTPTEQHDMKHMRLGEWQRAAIERFGPNAMDWTYKCPQCGGRQSARLFCKHGIEPKGRPYSSCIGRWVPSIGACSYSVRHRHDFIFRDPELVVADRHGQWSPTFPFADAKLDLGFEVKRFPTDGPKREPRRFYSRFSKNPMEPEEIE